MGLKLNINIIRLSDKNMTQIHFRDFDFMLFLSYVPWLSVGGRGKGGGGL